MIQPVSQRFPVWLRRSLPALSSKKTRDTLTAYGVHTVCQSALCPNCAECFSARTATFMILGNICTRRCRFCGVTGGVPEPVQADEPGRVAQAAREMGLDYVVITSVTRDDLPDEGAGQFGETVLAIRKLLPGAGIEILTPDFHGRPDLVAQVAATKPDVYNHNVETVRRLQNSLRPEACYERSLTVLRLAKKAWPAMRVKSGFMLGLGESREEVLELARDLREAGCDILTVGQYLAPSAKHEPVRRFVSPSEFQELREALMPLGFNVVYAGPYVRSSYHAKETFLSGVQS